MDKSINISVIGAGNMGSALINGLINAGYSEITACDTDPSKLKAISDKVKKTSSIVSGEIVILAVKPNTISEILKQLNNENIKKSVIISVAAGIRTKNIETHLNIEARVVRVMPNIPALVGEGCSAIYAKNSLDAELAKEIFSTVGKCFILSEEEQLDTATALCGSGPAFFALFIEALAKAAEKSGFSKELASEMALQTALGTSKFLSTQNVSTAKLQEMVSSPGGTTVAGLKDFEKNDFLKVVEEALRAATQRAREIASQR